MIGARVSHMRECPEASTWTSGTRVASDAHAPPGPLTEPAGSSWRVALIEQVLNPLRRDQRSGHPSVVLVNRPVCVGSPTMPTELTTQLVQAVSTQNEAALVECFSPDVEFRALIPPGLRERTGALEAAALSLSSGSAIPPNYSSSIQVAMR